MMMARRQDMLPESQRQICAIDAISIDGTASTGELSAYVPALSVGLTRVLRVFGIVRPRNISPYYVAVNA